MAVPPIRVTLFDVNVGIGVVVFLALSAVFRFLISTPYFFPRYAAGLRQGRNYFRWVEYSLSSSIMIWLIAAITGITDVAALFAIFALNASMIGFGALQEKYEPPRKQALRALHHGLDGRHRALGRHRHLLLRHRFDE